MILSATDISVFITTFKLATISTCILLLLGTPLAWWLARSTWRFKFLLEAIIALPLVLPPTVLGFYLLMAMGPQGFIGKVMHFFGLQSLAFTFSGLVIGSIIYSMPFVVQPLQSAFASLGQRPLDVAATLGASPLDRFFSIILPMARPGFLTAAVLGFAHTLGEFGVVLMMGGNIPGKTQVLSIHIYEQVENMQYASAYWLSGILLLLSFLLLILVYALNRHYRFMVK